MRIEFDPKADALYIHLREVPVEDNLGIEEGVTLDLDAQGHIVGLGAWGLNIDKRLSILQRADAVMIPMLCIARRTFNCPARGHFF